MLGIGFGEFVVLAVVLLIAVGPKAMPQLMRTVGKGLREVRQATRDLRAQTGIDELLRDVPTQVPNRRPAPKPRHEITEEDRRREFPPEGVDLAHARSTEKEAAAKDLGSSGDGSDEDEG
jgi:Tat protein translocase TatB subunit